jgi:hypothetical protein
VEYSASGQAWERKQRPQSTPPEDNANDACSRKLLFNNVAMRRLAPDEGL